MTAGDDDLPDRARRRLAVGLRPDCLDAAGRPLLVERAAGAWLVHTDGRRRIDLVMGNGALLLGHAAAEIDAGIRDALGRGTLCSLPHRLEVEVAERLVDAIPGAERVAFGKNGSDVCTAAMRIARAATGRPGVLQFGYHGFHDWTCAVNPAAEGVPPGLRDLVHDLPYGDLATAEAIFASHGEQVAAVIVEPFREAPADPAFLRRLRELTTRHGALLVFDEMVTGFRTGRGGAQQRFGITADLACFGKALAHGMPLSALTGRDELVAIAPRVAYSMTARGETLSLAAAKAALDVYATRDVAAELTAVGTAVREGFAAAARAAGSPARLLGDPAMMAFDLPDRRAFLHRAADHGVYTNGTLLPATVHAEHVDAIVAALAAALD